MSLRPQTQLKWLKAKGSNSGVLLTKINNLIRVEIKEKIIWPGQNFFMVSLWTKLVIIIFKTLDANNAPKFRKTSSLLILLMTSWKRI